MTDTSKQIDDEARLRSLTSTTVPPRLAQPAAPQVRRSIGRISRRDVVVLLGSGLTALATTGFVVVAFVLFVVVYALLVSLTEDRPQVVDRVMASLFSAAAVIAGAALVSVVGFTLWRGRTALMKSNLYVQDMSNAGPLDPLEKGGILHAMLGTVIIVSMALVVTVPLGLACAVFLNETRSRMRGFVRSVVTAMTALPSILAGLFIFATWVLILGFERSGFAASLAISIMMLPILVRSAEVVLRLVPGNLREASEATGAWCSLRPGPVWSTLSSLALRAVWVRQHRSCWSQVLRRRRTRIREATR